MDALHSTFTRQSPALITARLGVALVLGLGLAMVILCLLGKYTVSPVYAVSFGVDTTTDENDDSCIDGDCSLRDAIIVANGNGEADTIVLPAGTYLLTLTGTDEDAATTGDLDITAPLTITGAGPDQTIINANAIDRIFDIRPGASTVVISGVTIINGNVAGNGGGIYNADAALILTNTIIISNSAEYGGGVCVDSGSVTLNGGQIVSNSVEWYGGGIYVVWGSAALNGGQIVNNVAQYSGGGVHVAFGNATLSGGEIISNSAYIGGGVFVANGSATATLSGGYIGGNSAYYGGGVHVDSGSATLSGAEIISNSAQSGGGVFVAAGSATLSGGEITSNSAQSGGGVYVDSGSAMLSGAEIRNNFAPSGGGVYIASGNATLSGGEISSNSANGGGGGVYVGQTSAVFTQTGVSAIVHNNAQSGGGVYVFDGSAALGGGEISSNAAQSGGGVYVSNGSATLSDVRLLNNVASTGGALYKLGSSAFITVTHSCLVGNSATSVENPSPPDLDATGNWWGRIDGPSGLGPGGGDSVSANVDYSGFLTTTILSCPLLPVVVTTVAPPSSSHDASLDVTLSITLDSAISQTTVTTQTIFVHGGFQGHVDGAVGFGAPVEPTDIIYTPTETFHPGELVQTAVSAGVLGTGGAPTAPYVWQFRTAVSLGSGLFVAHPVSPTFGAGNSRDVALGDVDGDGDLDAVVANDGGQAQDVYLNDGGGLFVAHPVSPTFGGGDTWPIALGDVDGDGDLDAIVANMLQAQDVYLNDGSGGFSAHPTAPTFGFGNSWSIALGDVDGDGDLDAVLTDFGQKQDVYLNDGSGSFSAHPIAPTFGSGKCYGVALGDVDGDGDLDAVVAKSEGEAQDVYLNDGSGVFALHPTSPTFGAGYSTRVALGDLDGDGDLDAIVANYGDQAQDVYLNDGSGGFSAHPTSPTVGAGLSNGIALADVDGDGDLDALVANMNQAQDVYINDGSGGFSTSPRSPAFGAGSSHALAVGDVDGDGDLDVIVANTSGQAQTVWLNNNPPVADDDAFTVDEDSTDNPLDVLDGDTDADGDTLAVFAIGTTDQGGTPVSGGDVISYTPSPDFFGSEVFTYTATDSNGGFDTATVTITVTGLPDAPVADDDAFTVDEDSSDNPLDVLDGDTDADGDSLTVFAVGTPDQGGGRSTAATSSPTHRRPAFLAVRSLPIRQPTRTAALIPPRSPSPSPTPIWSLRKQPARPSRSLALPSPTHWFSRTLGPVRPAVWSSPISCRSASLAPALSAAAWSSQRQHLYMSGAFRIWLRARVASSPSPVWSATPLRQARSPTRP